MLYFDEKQYNTNKNPYRCNSKENINFEGTVDSGGGPKIQSKINSPSTCEFETILIENFFVTYRPPYVICQDACYNPLNNTYKPTGSPKICGIGITPNSPQPMANNRCCIYWDGRGFWHRCVTGLCPSFGPNNSVYWDQFPVQNCSQCY